MNARRALGIVIVFTIALQSSLWAASDVADAVMRGDLAALRTLLSKKADVNGTQVDGATALHWAVYRDDLIAADLLLQGGARPDVVNRTGITPLAMAAMYGNPRMID